MSIGVVAGGYVYGLRTRRTRIEKPTARTVPVPVCVQYFRSPHLNLPGLPERKFPSYGDCFPVCLDQGMYWTRPLQELTSDLRQSQFSCVRHTANHTTGRGRDEQKERAWRFVFPFSPTAPERSCLPRAHSLTPCPGPTCGTVLHLGTRHAPPRHSFHATSQQPRRRRSPPLVSGPARTSVWSSNHVELRRSFHKKTDGHQDPR